MASASAVVSLLHHRHRRPLHHPSPPPQRPGSLLDRLLFPSPTHKASLCVCSLSTSSSSSSSSVCSLSTEVPPKTLPFWVSRRNPGCRISLVSFSATALPPGMKRGRACELCDGEAVVRCEPDSAYLCRACDAHVHGANFLVARHLRRLLCRECGVLDPNQRPVSGLGFPPSRFVCRSCNDAYQGDGEGEGGDLDSDSDSDSASSSCCSSSLRSLATSSCVSNAGSEAAVRSGGEIAVVSAGGDGPMKAACSGSSGATELSECADRRRERRAAVGAARRRELDARTEAVVLSWCRRIGLDDARAPGAALHALVSGTRRITGAPFRVVAAGAVWSAARMCCAEVGGRRGEGALLRRLEACAGVPAKLIVVAEARLARAIRRRHVADEGEGWAECS